MADCWDDDCWVEDGCGVVEVDWWEEFKTSSSSSSSSSSLAYVLWERSTTRLLLLKPLACTAPLAPFVTKIKHSMYINVY